MMKINDLGTTYRSYFHMEDMYERNINLYSYTILHKEMLLL